MIGMHSSLTSLFFALLFTALGQMLFRMHFLRTGKKYLIAALVTFMAVPICNYLALLNLTLALVYMSTALTHVMVLMMSHFFLKERLTIKHYISMSLIVLGIATYNFAPLNNPQQHFAINPPPASL